VRLSRLFWFVVTILLGAAAGLGIGWYLRPAPMNSAIMTALRSDYRTDLVLMVAEAYSNDHDLAGATARLARISSEPAARTAQVAVVRAGELGYDQRDLEMLARLAQALVLPAGSGQ
jgi:hypothetical protein